MTLVLGTSTGGVGRHVRSVAAELVAAGAAVTVAGPAATEGLFGFTVTGATFDPVEIGALPHPGRDAVAVRRLREVLRGAACRARGACVVHAHGLRAGMLAGLATGRPRPGRVPLVVTWHNAVLGAGARRALLGRLERRVARTADVTLGASVDLVERARALGAADARLGPVAAPPLGSPSGDREALRRALGVGARPVVLTVGRLAPQKGLDVLLDAAADWPADGGPDGRGPLVLLAGDGPLRDPLAARVEAGRLPVRLLGHRADVPDLLAACDVVVLPSVWEARALAAQEALRAGRPLVATAVGGVPELVGPAALLVPPGDAEALRSAVDRVTGDPRLAARLAAAGREQAAGWPDERDTARQLLSVYRELTGGP